ncbi:MAG: hypothetical protein B7Y41_05705 [Hydrogenophilales bacterium 28-61-23]|nr:MAG: hypothetical protein B7Y41_05705 [Hydrogenophilales bacterium 28-61-23]
MNTRIPKSLFKYLRFSDKLLEQLCYDKVYFADPASFNDPLDCLPVVEADLQTDELESLLAQLVANRSAKEIDAAMKKVRLRGDNATARLNSLTGTEVRNLIGEISYNATNPEVEDRETYIKSAFRRAIERELHKSHETGVLCLSSKFDSPLMWSHYANQHRGVCVEYDLSKLTPHELHKVTYGESRKVLASQINNWVLHNDTAARQAINKASLLTKSGEWAYEREWRLLGQVGLGESPMRLKSVIFGMRCADVLKYTVVKALEGRADSVKFWEIVQPTDQFRLKRSRLDIDELMLGMPRCSAFHDFDDLDAIDGETNRTQ